MNIGNDKTTGLHGYLYSTCTLACKLCLW
jgi:hypothetical protein